MAARGDAFFFRGPPDGLFEFYWLVERQDAGLVEGDELVITSVPAGIDCRFRVTDRGYIRRECSPESLRRRTAFGANIQLRADLTFQPVPGRAAPELDARWSVGWETPNIGQASTHPS